MLETEALRWKRNDIPDVITFWEQGSKERKTPWLDGDCYYRQINGKTNKVNKELYEKYNLYVGKNQKLDYKETNYLFRRPTPVGIMNDRDFRERCTEVGNTLQTVYIKSCEDDLRIVHDPEWIKEQIGCKYVDAVTLAESFRRLGINRNTVYKLINGYWDEQSKGWKRGLKNIGTTHGAHYAKVLEDLCIETDAITEAEQLELDRQFFLKNSQDMIESGDWCLQYGTHEVYWNDQMKYIEEMITIVDDPDDLIIVEQQEDEFEGFIGYFGDEEIEIPQSLTATWRLYDGSETLDHDTICEIKEADVGTIGIIIRKMYPQWQGRKLQKAEWGYHKNWWQSGWMTEP